MQLSKIEKNKIHNIHLLRVEKYCGFFDLVRSCGTRTWPIPNGNLLGFTHRKSVLLECTVFTVEEMMPHLQAVSGAVSKNLFLKDKKKKGLWLVSARHDRQVNLNDLAKKLGVGSGNLRFADEAIMVEKLKVGQGCATALSLLFDREKSVKFMVYFHPMTNAASMGLKPEDLLRFLRETGHEPILQSFD
uniref:PrdX deacylase domain-containing protein 1 n=1 Tax=Neogobius melanostomus TaxID=47308 RepID=A0A8C6S2Q6_9GOBI